MSDKPEPLFVDLHDNSKPAEIESMCMRCQENGTTRMLFTKIPHFKEIIIMAFECPHCGFRNNELQSAGAFNEKAQTVTCKVSGKEDLDRQLVKSDFAAVKFEEIDLEVPASRRRGLLTTIEGLIGNVIDDLEVGQPVRKHTDENVYNQIEAILAKLRSYQEGQQPFTLTIDDASGNSYIENKCLPAQDPKLTIKWHKRTAEEDAFLGLQHQEEQQQQQQPDVEGDEVPEVMTFPANCSHCNAPSTTNMHVMDIPHFKEVVIMATNCEHCGYKSNEVKAGGPISAQGKRITLKITDTEDLSRDILKSETCGLSIPEIDLELTPGTLGGRFTTVEGLLRQVHDELEERVPFMHGDSTTDESRKRWDDFLKRLSEVADGQRIPITLVLDDPLANSYLQNLYAPDDDPEMTIEMYDRDWETNESLGLNDMKLEGYEKDQANKN